MPIRNKVQPGERRILADEYNAFLAMTQQAKLGIGSSGFNDFYQASRAYVKNTTAAKVSAFEVLALDSPVITRQENNPEFFGAPTFNGVAPDIDLHKGKFAILQEPAMPGDTVRAVIAGGTWAWLNVVDEDDTTAEIADGVRAYVETGTSGTAKIIWKEAGLGVRVGFIVLNAARSQPVCAYMSGAASSITFNAVGANKIPWGAMWYTDEATLSVGTHSFSGVDYYEHFLAHKAGVYFVDVIVNVNANFSYSMTSPITGLGAAMDDFDMEALVTDKDGNDFSPLHTSRHRLVMRGSTGSAGMRHSIHHLWAVRLTDESKAPYKISTTHAANDYNSKAYTYTLERGVTRCWYAGPGGS